MDSLADLQRELASVESHETTHIIWEVISASELLNINFSLSIQYQLFFFPSYQYQFQYQLIQRGLININILSIIQKFPYQFQYQYQLIDSFININISSHLKPFKISACLKYSYCRSTANFKVK